MRLYSLRFGCLLAVACVASLTWIKSTPGDGGSPAVPDLQTLYERLLVAEDLGGRVSRDLSSILDQLRNASANATCNATITATITAKPTEPLRQQTNDSSSRLLQSNIYLYLPHLRQHADRLRPHVVLGRDRRGVSMVLGIPTVKRDKRSYLSSTLSSLLYGLSPAQQQDLLIVVFVAETDSDYVAGVADSIRKKFPQEVQSGLLEVVSPPQFYYPDFNTIKETFGDSKDRVKWRTKQNLDFSFLMLYAQDKGTYYVQLEDDVVAKAGYFNDMKTAAAQQDSDRWLFLEFSQLGFIGKMFRSVDLPMVVDFFLMFHRDKPIDWLLDHILWVKVCSPERDAKHCNTQKALLKRRIRPSLFQHVGLHSSLPGKLQRLKDKDFGKQILYQAHRNPEAVLSSSLTHYQQHSLERAYQGQDFFWALTPARGDHILFSFPQPIHVSRFLFRSGNIETRGDQLTNTTVEVLPGNAAARDKLAASSSYRESDGGFIIIAAFQNGVAEGNIQEVLQPVSALRLVVHADADVWAVLSEIHITV